MRNISKVTYTTACFSFVFLSVGFSTTQKLGTDREDHGQADIESKMQTSQAHIQK